MREYNSSTDYWIIQAVADMTEGNSVSLASVKMALNTLGIGFPANFNSDRSPTAWSLDFDMCRSKGRTKCKTWEEFRDACRR